MGRNHLKPEFSKFSIKMNIPHHYSVVLLKKGENEGIGDIGTPAERQLLWSFG